MKVLIAILGFGLTGLLDSVLSQTAFTIDNVSVAPNQTNNNGRFTINARLANNAFVNLDANIDSIHILFNDSTTVPASIDPSLILINNVAANVATVSGQLLSVLTPVNIHKKGATPGTFTMIIDSAAAIRNPAVPGDYRIRGSTTKEPSPLAVSPVYTISPSTSSVSQAAVTPNTSVQGILARYTVSFNLGSGGFLAAGSGTITVVFPAKTGVPNGAISGVKVNGSSAFATGNNDTVVVVTPVDLPGNSSVEVFFSIGSGLTNPDSVGNYQVRVRTSTETTLIASDTYSISAAVNLSVTAVLVEDDTVNAPSLIEFVFVTGASGALVAGVDTVVIVMSQNSFLPSTFLTSTVVVTSGGFSDNAADVTVLKSVSLDDDTIFVVTPINVAGSGEITITLMSTSGYKNPSVAGNYRINMRTSKEPTFILSNPYNIKNTVTTVSQAIVTPGTTTPGAFAFYKVEFNLGARGRLPSGTGVITLDFDSSFTINANRAFYDSVRISVAEGPFVTIDTSGIGINTANNTIQVTIPDAVVTDNNDNIVLFIDGKTTDPINNPPAGNYVLGVKTSVEVTNVNSSEFNIGGTSVVINSVTLGDRTVNNASSFTISLSNVLLIRPADADFIKVTFPEGTTLPATISTSAVTINGVNPNIITVNQSTRSVTLAVGSNVQNNVTVIFTSGANVVNAAVPSATFYRLTLYTSKDLAPVTSSAYLITGDSTKTTGVAGSANPSVRTVNNSVYTINVMTSSTGKIVGGAAAGSSTISVFFDSGTVVPASIIPSTVKVNGVSCELVTVLSAGMAGSVRIRVPGGLSIGNNTGFTVIFSAGSGLDNADTVGTFNLRIKTSSDTSFSDTAGAAGDYVLTNLQPLSFTSVTAAPSTQNANAGYSVKFTTGSLGALSAGENVRIVFPSNTFVPALVSKSDVFVNSLQPPVNPTVSQDTITISVPDTLPPLTPVTILFNQSTGLLNPTLVNNYTASVLTASEPGPFVSPTYPITATSSSITVASVTPDDPRLSAQSKYTISFNLGTNGRLLAGTSSITVVFNSSTLVSTDTTNYDSCYIIAKGTSTQVPKGSVVIAGKSVTLPVPVGVTAGNNDNVVVVLDRLGATKPITNPGTEGSYTLAVRTSVEPTQITSNPYSISDVSSVSNLTVVVVTDTVNAVSADTLSFLVDPAFGALSAGSGKITVTFPSNTFVPVSISTANVRVSSDSLGINSFFAASAVVTNPSTRTAVITTPVPVRNGDSVRVVFFASAGLVNPSVFGNYTLRISTSSQPLDGVSATYSLKKTNTKIRNLAVSIDPAQPGDIAQYRYAFVTGSRGRLLSGVSTITLLVPKDATFTLGEPQTSKVRVNSTSADAVSLRPAVFPDPDTLEITVPSSVTIGSNSGVVVVVDSSAGLMNASTATSLKYRAYTSVEADSIVDYDLSLPVELSFFAVTQANRKKAVEITWRTESEVDNAHFLVQKRAASDEFETIRVVGGQGTKPSETDYLVVDSDVEKGTVYTYRLADVSFSGAITYHDELSVEISVPREYGLFQNFPNPFNPMTRISYDLPVRSRVTLVVYNILGQEVVRLVDGEQDAGFFELIWNGKNRFGLAVASGVYIYRMAAKGIAGERFSGTKKMMVIK